MSQSRTMAWNLKEEEDEEIKQDQDQDQFQRLPDDVVMLIINKLIHMKTLIRFSLVAKRYSSLVPKTHSLFVDLNTLPPPPPPKPTFMGHLGGFVRNLVAKLRRSVPTPNVRARPINKECSLPKDGFKQLKHLHTHYGVNPSSPDSWKTWVSVYGSTKSHFEICSCLMASFVNSNPNPSVAAAGNHANSVMLARHSEDPQYFLDSFIMILKHLRERDDIIREVVLVYKMLETFVFTDDKIIGGNFIMGKELIARLQGQLEVSDSNSDPVKLLASVVHFPTLVLPKSGYTLNDVIIMLAIPDDKDHQNVHAEENMELGILDGSVLEKCKVLDEAIRLILGEDNLDQNTNKTVLGASYVNF